MTLGSVEAGRDLQAAEKLGRPVLDTLRRTAETVEHTEVIAEFARDVADADRRIVFGRFDRERHPFVRTLDPTTRAGWSTIHAPPIRAMTASVALASALACVGVGVSPSAPENG